MEEMRRGGRERAECDRRRLQPFSFPFSSQTSGVKKQKSEELFFFFTPASSAMQTDVAAGSFPKKLASLSKKKSSLMRDG